MENKVHSGTWRSGNYGISKQGASGKYSTRSCGRTLLVFPSQKWGKLQPITHLDWRLFMVGYINWITKFLPLDRINCEQGLRNIYHVISLLIWYQFPTIVQLNPTLSLPISGPVSWIVQQCLCHVCIHTQFLGFLSTNNGVQARHRMS